MAFGILGGLGASMTLMACYGAPPSSCYETITLPDGGRKTDYVCGEPVRDAGPDDGGRTDAGASDAGVTVDAGLPDAGP